ncbi:MAG: FHA domain-containing protein [Coriobacteriia bacterium]|nr:FHA domain-containing protein [Coriobacteriia bacterium]
MDVCPSCESPVAPDATACPECGATLEGTTAAFDVVSVPEGLPETIEVVTSDVPVLVVGKGAEVGERFHLEQPELTIGRDPDSDIFLNDVTVSRRHSRLLVVGSVVTVEDAGSLNGTYVNDILVDAAILRDGDTLQIGRFRMVFLSGGA